MSIESIYFHLILTCLIIIKNIRPRSNFLWALRVAKSNIAPLANLTCGQGKSKKLTSPYTPSYPCYYYSYFWPVIEILNLDFHKINVTYEISFMWHFRSPSVPSYGHLICVSNVTTINLLKKRGALLISMEIAVIFGFFSPNAVLTSMASSIYCIFILSLSKTRQQEFTTYLRSLKIAAQNKFVC